SVVILLIGSNLIGLWFVKWAAVTFVSAGVLAIVLFLAGAVFWYFWNGRNWARWLLLIGACNALLALLRPSARPMPIKVMDALFGLFLLCWLNARHVK